MSIQSGLTTLAPQSGAAIHVSKGDILRIVSVADEQVADLALFDALTRDSFSGGRTIDYNERIDLQVGDILFSRRSTALAKIVEDTVRVHDLLLSPCSRVMFERRGELSHPSCHENLALNLAAFEIMPDDVHATVNVFMDVRVGQDKSVTIFPPPNRLGDRFAVEALCDLIVGITACSSELTNNGSCKPVAFAHLAG